MTTYKYCFVENCNNTTFNAPNKIFVHVPKNPDIRRKWFEAVGCPLKKLKSTAYCCEDHLNLEEDLENYTYWKVAGGRKRLKPDAIPQVQQSLDESACNTSSSPVIIEEVDPLNLDEEEMDFPEAIDQEQIDQIVGNRNNFLHSKWDTLFENNSKEWISFTPALGLTVYPCYSCRHMFSTRRTFQDHINRRAIVLKYNCSSCSSQLSFFNRCSFLLHTRKHYSILRGEINLTELEILPLPLGLAGFLPHPNISILYNDKENDASDNLYINTQFYYPDKGERGKSVVVLKPTELNFCNGSLALKQNSLNTPRCVFISVDRQMELKQISDFFNNNSIEIKEEPTETPNFTIPIISKIESLNESENYPRCMECNKLEKISMEKHYIGDNTPFIESLKCHNCKFVASTECSLKAHMRIHIYKPPFVCPDCGKDFKEFNDLKHHLSEVCFHLNKHIRYRCPGKKCGKLFALIETYISHFENHMLSFFQCNLCNNVLFKEEDFIEHKKTHTEECTPSKIYHCTVCTNSENFNDITAKQHIRWHTNDRQRCMYVYSCKYCRKYFRSTATYATHLEKCSKINGNGTTAKKSFDIVKYSICVKCKQTVVKDNSKLCTKCKDNSYIVSCCKNCSTQIAYAKDDPSSYCIKCSEVRKKHLMKKSTLKTIEKPVSAKKYYCILCNKQIQSQEKSSHIKECKYGDPVVIVEKLENKRVTLNSSSSSTSESDSPTKMCQRTTKPVSPRSDDSTKKKRKRYNLLNKNKKHCSSSSEVEPDLQAEKPMEFDGTYTCKVCNYSNNNRLDFQDHIIQHREVSTAYQCMECGECFVVKPSLVKHLLHYHLITDAEQYFTENNCFDQSAVKELADAMNIVPGERKDVKENQCRVCELEFEDSVSLSKHFRMHGMAFLRKNLF